MKRPLRVPVPGLAAGGRFALPREAARYVARVHRGRVGDKLLLFDAGKEAAARLVALEGDDVIVEAEAPVGAAVVATREVVLVQAIGKGDKMDAVVRDATELGATRVVPVETQRGVVKLGARAGARVERWRAIAREAARQSGRADAPAIDEPCSLSRALADVHADTRIALAPTGAARAADVLLGARSIALLVGPEGGLADDELAEAERAGWQAASLGPFVLRTETVAAAVLGAILILGEHTPPR